MSRNCKNDRVAERRAREARAAAVQQLLGLTAFRGANPTTDELPAFTPGKPIDSLRAVTGASPTEDQAGAQADLGVQLRNEELNRAATQNAPLVERVQRSLAVKRAGLDENNMALGRLHDTQAADAETRGNVMRQFIDDPNAHPLLKLDAAQKKDVFKPQRVKVRRADGSEVYMNETPTLSGVPTYTPATDDAGGPLRLPRLDTERPERRTSEQRDIDNRARIMETGTPAEKAALQGKDTRKRKSIEERWGEEVFKTSRENFGRYGRDPQKLHEATAKRWRVAYPYEPVPGLQDTIDALQNPPAADQGATAPAAGPSASAVPPPAQRKQGQTYPTPRGPMTWTGTGWLPAN